MNTVDDFLEAVYKGELTQLDMYNYVEIFTSGFELKKIQMLFSEVEIFISIMKDEFEGEITEDQINKEIELWKARGKEIPYKILPKLKYEKGKKPVQEGTIKLLDLEKLIYPLEFFYCNQLKGLILKKLREFSVETPTKTLKLKVPQIALIYVYNGDIITRENCNGIAAKYGYTSKSSGEGLYQDFIKFSSAANRKGVKNSSSAIQITNKITLLKSIEMQIDSKAHPRLQDEIKALETLLNSITL